MKLLLVSAAAALCSDSQLSCLSATNTKLLNDELCRQMPGMIGCSLRTICKGEAFCSENSVYATICQDMPMMKPCQAFQQCSIQSCGFPTSANVTKQIYSICTEMNMAGCEKCSIKETSTYSECDLMTVYSDLCKAMPNMSQCSMFKNLCMASPEVPFCGNGDMNTEYKAPVMQMFFHTGLSDYILFEQWVPRNVMQYIFAWIVVFFVAVGYEGLNVYVYIQETKWSLGNDTKPVDLTAFGSNVLGPKMQTVHQMCGLSNGKQGVKQSAIRAMLRMLSTLIGYTLMLIAMTFNIGLFVAIIVGFGAGTFVFAPMIKNLESKALDNNECH